MELFPAIDLIGGRSVRLTQGDFGQVSDYGDPLEVARGFVAAGVGWVHIVDLDAARSGVAHNLEVIEAVAALGTRVQCGGGVRTALDAQRLFDVGVHRLVLGTAAIENPDLLASLARTFPGRIAAGLDHRHIDTGAPRPPSAALDKSAPGAGVAGDGGACASGEAAGSQVAVRGWQQTSGMELLDALHDVGRSGAGAVVVTEIGRDGMLSGPDYDGLAQVLSATSMEVVASGGVADLEDLRRLARLEVDGKTLAGVIVGKALSEGRMGIDEALAACAT